MNGRMTMTVTTYIELVKMMNDSDDKNKKDRANLLLDKLREQLEETLRLQKELKDALNKHLESTEKPETVIERENVVVIR